MISRRRLAATRQLGLLLALLLVTAACGQKEGVARLTAQGGGSSVGSGSGFDDGSGSGFGDESLGDPSIDGGGVPADGGAVDPGAAGGGAPGTPGGQPAGGGTAQTPRGGGSPPGGGSGGGGAAGAIQGPKDTTGISATEIKIGIHAPITGAAAVSTFEQGVGVYSHFAGQIAALGNRKITVVDRDDKFDPSAARAACRELVEKEKVFVLIGGAGADQIKACAEYANSVGVPYLSPGVTEGGFDKLPLYFALSETYNQQNIQLAQLIKNQINRPKKLAILLTDSPLLSETEASMKKAAADAGIEVVYTGRLEKNAGKNQTDTEVSKMKGKAEIIYALIPPTVFAFLIASAREQQFFPTYVGPGLSIGVNLVAKPVCAQPPFPDVRYLSPMVQMDVINTNDPDYVPAYGRKPGNSAADQPDDIGILLWGLEKLVRQMLEATAGDLSRQGFVKALESGKTFTTNVYAPVKFGGLPHFGANAVTLLRLDCQRLEFTTEKQFASNF